MLMHVAKLYLQSYYQAAAPYGGLQGAQQYNAVFGATAAAGLTMAPNHPTGGVYPYFQYGPASAAAAGYSMAQYPQLYQQYAAAAAAVGATTAVAGGIQQYGGGVVTLSPNSVGQAGIVVVVLLSPCFCNDTAGMTQGFFRRDNVSDGSNSAGVHSTVPVQQAHSFSPSRSTRPEAQLGLDKTAMVARTYIMHLQVSQPCMHLLHSIPIESIDRSQHIMHLCY
jgi:hypothetical protein